MSNNEKEQISTKTSINWVNTADGNLYIKPYNKKIFPKKVLAYLKKIQILFT